MDSDATLDAGRALRRKIITDTLLLNGAAIFGQILGIAQRFLVMRVIAPEAFGLWLAALIVIGYASYSSVGLEHGMGVRVPYYKGKNDESAIERIRITVYSVWTMIAVLVAIGVATYAAFQSRPELRWSFFAVAVLVLLEQQIQFFTRWHSSATQNFALITRLSVARAAMTFLLVVPLAYAFGLYGLVAGSVGGVAVTVILWRRFEAPPLRFRVDREALNEVLRIGFPILVVVLLGGLIDSIDRAVIGLLLGATALGYYGVTTLGGASVYGLLAQAGSAMSPHMAADFGRSNDSPAALERYLVKPTILFATMAAMLVTGVMYFVPPVVRLFLPKYAPGLTAFYVYTPGFFFLALIITANNIVNLVLIAQRRQRLFVYLQAMAVLLEIGMAVGAIRGGFGMPGVAFASTFAYATYALTTVVLAAKFVLGTWSRIVAFVAKLLLPMAYLGLASLVIFQITRSNLTIVQVAAVRLALFIIATTPLLVRLFRLSGGSVRALFRLSGD